MSAQLVSVHRSVACAGHCWPQLQQFERRGPRLRRLPVGRRLLRSRSSALRERMRGSQQQLVALRFVQQSVRFRSELQQLAVRLCGGFLTLRCLLCGPDHRLEQLRPVRCGLSSRRFLPIESVQLPGRTHFVRRCLRGSEERRQQLRRVPQRLPRRTGLFSRRLRNAVHARRNPMRAELREPADELVSLRTVRPRVSFGPDVLGGSLCLHGGHDRMRRLVREYVDRF
jgi:hypothetical protein